MRSDTQQPSTPTAAAPLREWLDAESSNHATWLQAQNLLRGIAGSAGAADLHELEECATLLTTLLEIVETQTPESSSPSNDIKEILAFVQSSAPQVLAALESDDTPLPTLQDTIDQARNRWGDCLQLLGPNGASDDSVEHRFDDLLKGVPQRENNEALGFVPENCAEQISLLLSAIRDQDRESTDFAGGRTATGVGAPTIQLALDSMQMCEMHVDLDLRDAFLQDASRCLSAIEQTVLESEANPRNGDHYRQICRELHTLKGASASVGLSDLANYLHEVEAALERHSDSNEQLNTEMLLAAVDAVRSHVGPLESGASPTAAHLSTSCSTADPGGAVVSSPSIISESSDGDVPSSVRVRSSKLDRLMDMLAELVVLRNRRETQISELNLLNQELGYCAARLKQFSDQLCDVSKVLPVAENNPTINGPSAIAADFGLAYLGLELASSKAIAEVASDLSEISRGIRDFYRPIGEENVALTHFIRQFRQEMMQLRRLPVSGLFQRLQRAARDAARAEGKQVQIQFIGHQTAIEQSLQEQLYDPLLHIVRNAVSHGIEDATTRTARGKSAVGQVTLQITSSANLLGINVADDGQGLDYDALRRRGYECGLLSPDRSPTHQELAKLIFQPGFSTRDAASEVSGRGVGMDVAATAIDRLHGRIEVDSSTGQGTTIRLSIPLRSGIEHAMVFRSGGQLFAVPMQSVSAAQNLVPLVGHPGNLDQLPPTPSISFSRVANLPSSENRADNRLLVLDLDSGNRGGSVRVNLIVDAIVGGEEVVVRALPRSLKQHPFAGGVTLSGGGAMVLTIDPIRLWDLCRPHLAEIQTGDRIDFVATAAATSPKRVLVVDDSLSARMSLVKRLNRHGLEIVEACDGLQALDCLRRDTFQLVITDLDMPRLGGLELLGEIRQRHLLDTPVVVVSSRTEESLRARAKRYGAQAFLNKPVTDASLAGLLQQLSLIGM